MPKKRAFIVLIPGIAANAEDSTCLPFQQLLLKELYKLDRDTIFFVFPLHYPYSRQAYTLFNCEVKPLGGRGRGGINKWIRRGKILSAIKQLSSQFSIKGILSFWLGEAAWIAQAVSKKYDIPHYCWLMGQDAKPGNSLAKNKLMDATKLIALSDYQQEYFAKNYGYRPQHCIYPGLAIEQFGPPPAAKSIDLLGVGSLIKLKQFDLFVRIISQLQKTIPGIQAAIIGKGPEEENLKKLINELGLNDHIQLYGELSWFETIQKMQSAKILLHTSQYEGFSGVCMEALYAGAHVVSSTRAVNKEVDHWHILSTTDQLVEKCLSLLNDPAITYDPVCIQTMETTARQIWELYAIS